jgi:type IV pilus assembly protein PilF
VHKKWFLLFTFAMSVWTGCAGPQKGSDHKANMYLKLGTSQIEAGDYPKALRNLLDAENIDPDNPYVHNNLGLVYFFRDHLPLAEKHLRKAISLDSKFTDAKNNLGRILTEKGDYKGALQILNEAFKDLTYDQPAKIIFNLGLVHFKQKNYLLARPQFEKAIQLGQENCLTENYLGRTYFENREYERATLALDRAVGYCQTIQFDEPHYYSALAYYQIGNKSKAEARLQEVLKLYSQQGRYQEQARSLLQTLQTK